MSENEIAEASEPWHAIPLTDEEFAASYGPALEMDKAKCSVCDALLKGGICLNACHLGSVGKRRFQDHLISFAESRKRDGSS